MLLESVQAGAKFATVCNPTWFWRSHSGAGQLGALQHGCARGFGDDQALAFSVAGLVKFAEALLQHPDRAKRV